jgi:hypothetical protein
MTLLRGRGDGPNKGLKGHKLLVLVPWTPSAEDLDKIRSQFPGLEIVFHELAWAQRTPPSGFPPEEWKDVTILLTGSALPSLDMAPKLQYVQLTSAGANHILKEPLFLETDVAFCTANGVHG